MEKKVQVILALLMVLKEGLKDNDFLKLFSGNYSREVMDKHIDIFSSNSRQEINLNMAIVPILTSIEENGIALDFENLKQDKIDPLREELEILLQKPTLFGMKKDVGTYSWTKEVLEKNNYESKSIRDFKNEVDSENELLLDLKKVDQITKVIGTYERLKGTEKDGKIHTNFIPYSGLSGRMISHSPSTQNFPSDWKNYLKTLREGESVIELDLKNAEVLAIAKLSEEDKILEIMDKSDFYNNVACQIFGISEDRVTEIIRKTFKKVVNAINYGSGGAKIAEIINESGILSSELPPDQGGMIKNEYLDIFPKVKEYQKEQASTNILTTATGHVFNLQPSYKNISFGPQNLIATLMKKLLIALDEKGYTKNIINIVHDSIWVSCNDDILDDIKDIMSKVFCDLINSTDVEGIELIKATKLGGNGNV